MDIPSAAAGRTTAQRFTCLGSLSVSAIALLFFPLHPASAHEHEHTHYKLTKAAVRFADNDVIQTPALNGGLSASEIEDEIAQGVIDEDECIDTDGTGGTDADGNVRRWGEQPNWNSHFYEAKRGVRLGIAEAGTFFGCLSGGGNPLPAEDFTNAADRAQRLWVLAIEDYRDGMRLRESGASQQARAEYRSAYRILGRVLHLLEDMTSPAHVHDSPHGQILDSSCERDSDDFERWGWCGDENNDFISDYFNDSAMPQECLVDIDRNGSVESFGVPPAGITCRLWAGLQRIYAGEPQGGADSLYPVSLAGGQTLPFAFVDHVANETYDFSTFRVHLKDDTAFTDVQDASELKSMLRGSGPDDCGAGTLDKGLCDIAGGWWIGGEHQRIGRTQGFCGSVEGAAPDASEEWYVMETGCTRRRENFGTDIFVDGFAFIENIGGEGSIGIRNDSFIPVRYGCTAANSTLCGDVLGSRSKILYQRLYGTTANQQDPFNPQPGLGKTMPRIYGDVLFATAVAYGAGLIGEFIDEATMAPEADAGGPYEVEACQPVTLDAGASTDENGTIVSYEWDFTNDGSYDVLVEEATHEHNYPDVFSGQLAVRVTDDDGFDDEATADVNVTPDVTPPMLEEIASDPPYLWPPNHKMVPVTVSISTEDACAEQTECRITNVRSSQPVTSRNDDTSPDWVITGDLTVDLRAERMNDVENNGNGNGIESSGLESRDYDLSLECTDAAGNVGTGNLIVRVNKSAVQNSGNDDGEYSEDDNESETDGDSEDGNQDEDDGDGGNGGQSGSTPSPGSTSADGSDSAAGGSGAVAWPLLLLLILAAFRRQRLRSGIQ